MTATSATCSSRAETTAPPVAYHVAAVPHGTPASIRANTVSPADFGGSDAGADADPYPARGPNRRAGQRALPVREEHDQADNDSRLPTRAQGPRLLKPFLSRRAV